MCYPILLKKFDLANEEMMNTFLYTVIPFAESSFDYLLLLVADDEGKVLPNAIKFPKRLFKYLDNVINLRKEEEMEHIEFRCI